MVSITLSVPKEVRILMKKFPEVNWSGLIRKTIEEKARRLALKQELLKEFDKGRDFDKWAVKIIREGRRKKWNLLWIQIFCFFWQKSPTKKLLEDSYLELFSPEISLREIDKYANLIMKKVGITKKEFNLRLVELKSIVNFIPKKEFNPGVLIERADKALYEVKKESRNNCKTCSEEN